MFYWVLNAPLNFATKFQIFETISLNLILGNERCPGSSIARCQPKCGFDYKGCRLDLVENVTSWYRCSKLCANVSNCKGWTWASLKDKCYLKHTLCSPRILRNFVSGSSTTHIDCEASCGKTIFIKQSFAYLKVFHKSFPNNKHIMK